MKEKYTLYTTHGMSMWPFLKSGESILIESIPFNKLHIGDIIAFDMTESIFCHRVVKKYIRNNAPYCYCCGDNNAEGEDIAFDRIKGRVKAIIQDKVVIDMTTITARIIALIIVEIIIPSRRILWKIRKK